MFDHWVAGNGSRHRSVRSSFRLHLTCRRLTTVVTCVWQRAASQVDQKVSFLRHSTRETVPAEKIRVENGTFFSLGTRQPFSFIASAPCSLAAAEDGAVNLPSSENAFLLFDGHFSNEYE